MSGVSQKGRKTRTNQAKKNDEDWMKERIFGSGGKSMDRVAKGKGDA